MPSWMLECNAFRKHTINVALYGVSIFSGNRVHMDREHCVSGCICGSYTLAVINTGGSLCLSCVPCMSNIDTSHEELIAVSIIELAILYIHTFALWLGISGTRFICSLGNSFHFCIIQCGISPAGRNSEFMSSFGKFKCICIFLPLVSGCFKRACSVVVQIQPVLFVAVCIVLSLKMFSPINTFS